MKADKTDLERVLEIKSNKADLENTLEIQSIMTKQFKQVIVLMLETIHLQT